MVKASSKINLEKVYTYYPIFIIAIIISTINLLTINSLIGGIFTLIQLVWIGYLLIINKIEDALIWHLIFIILSVSSQNAAAINGGQIALTNYAELKLIGPIRISYVVTIFLCLISRRKIRKSKGDSLILILKTFITIAIIGDIIGIIGLTLMQYYSLDAFVTYNVYIWICIITLYTVLKYNSQYLISVIYKISVPILAGCVFGSLIGMLLGIRTSYGGHEDLPLTLDLFYYSPILLLSIIFVRKHIINQIISCIIMFGISFLNMSGKSVFIIVFAILWIIIYTYANKYTNANSSNKIRYLRFIVPLGIVCLSLYLPRVMNNGDSMSGYKIASAMSVFSGDLEDVSRSPAIRIGETANIFYNNRNNPIRMFLGNGYGGYFTDELGLFDGLEVWKGGWNEKIVSSGRFPTAHDTFAVVPLCNGILGLILILNLCRVFMLKIKNNFLNFAVVPWILFTFYFSTLCAITGIFFLIGGQKQIQNI